MIINATCTKWFENQQIWILARKLSTVVKISVKASYSTAYYVHILCWDSVLWKIWNEEFDHSDGKTDHWGGKETTTQVWSSREVYTKENYFEIITPIILIKVLEGLRLAPGRWYKERSGSWK